MDKTVGEGEGGDVNEGCCFREVHENERESLFRVAGRF